MNDREFEDLAKFVDRRFKKKNDSESDRRLIRELVRTYYSSVELSNKEEQELVDECLRYVQQKRSQSNQKRKKEAGLEKMANYGSFLTFGFLVGTVVGGTGLYYLVDSGRMSIGTPVEPEMPADPAAISNLEQRLAQAEQENEELERVFESTKDKLDQQKLESEKCKLQVESIEARCVPSRPTSTSTGTPASPGNEPIASVSGAGITIQIDRCNSVNRNQNFQEVVCDIEIINDSNTSRIGIGSSSNQFIALGMDFPIAAIKLGDSSGNSFVRNDIPQNSSLKGSIEFESVPNSVSRIEVFNLTVKKDYADMDVEFRDLPIQS
jgi:hypothetical protein